MTIGKHEDVLYFAKLADIHEQVNVIGIPQYADYKNGVFPNVEKTYLSAGSSYTLSPYEELLGIEDDGSIVYTLNSSGQRCDEFTKSHSGKHVIFAGCSYTSGESLPYMENWSGRLYNKIKQNNDLSGYYTVAYPGGGIDVIINNIFQYCDIYGTPDIIFMLIPETSRKFSWARDRYYSLISPYNGEYFFDSHGGFENALYYSYNLIKNLEIFCNKMGIKLIWSTWVEKEGDFFKTMNFTNYVHITLNDLKKNLTNYQLISDKYFNMARDNSHPGVGYSDSVSNIFLKEFNEKYIL